MYYSSKIVVDTNPPVTTHSFQGWGKTLPPEASSEQVETQRKLEEQIVYLGQVGELYYHSVPDGLELCEQPAKAEVTKLEFLPPEVESELTLNGDYAQQVRYASAITNLKYPYDVFHERNLAHIWMAIEDISSLLCDILEQSVMAIDTVDGSDRSLAIPKVNPAIERLKKLKMQSDAVNQALAKVGLGA